MLVQCTTMCTATAYGTHLRGARTACTRGKAAARPRSQALAAHLVVLFANVALHAVVHHGDHDHLADLWTAKAQGYKRAQVRQTSTGAAFVRRRRRTRNIQYTWSTCSVNSRKKYSQMPMIRCHTIGLSHLEGRGSANASQTSSVH